MIVDILILPVAIFLARVLESALETIRTVYIARGHPYLAAGIGMIKVAIWLLSTGLVITNLTNIPADLAYIAGYGIGTVLGMDLECRVSLGHVIVRVFAPKESDPIVSRFRDLGFGITRVEGTGGCASEVSILLLIVPRSRQDLLLSVIRDEFPDLLFTIEDIRSMKEHARIYHQDEENRVFRFFGML